MGAYSNNLIHSASLGDQRQPPPHKGSDLATYLETAMELSYTERVYFGIPVAGGVEWPVSFSFLACGFPGGSYRALVGNRLQN